MHIYKLSTFSYEEHSECLVASEVKLTQEQLNEKFLNVLVASAKRSNKLHHEKVKRTFHSFGEIFSLIQDEDLEKEGLTLLKPEATSLVDAWHTGLVPYSKEFTMTGDVTEPLVNSLDKLNIRNYKHLNPWIDEDDYGDYEEDIEQFDV